MVHETTTRSEEKPQREAQLPPEAEIRYAVPEEMIWRYHEYARSPAAR